MVILSTIGRFGETRKKGLFFYHEFDGGKIGIVRASQKKGRLLRFHLTKDEFEKIRNAVKSKDGEYSSLEELKQTIKQELPVFSDKDIVRVMQNDGPGTDWIAYIAAIIEYEGDIEIKEPVRIIVQKC